MLVWMREQSRRGLQAHLIDDERTPVAALGDVAGVAEALHQLRPGSGHALGAPAGARRLSGEPVARHRRDHDVECVFGLPAVSDGIGQRSDELDLLEHRARPAVVDDQRKRILLLRPDVDEMNVEPVDVGHELRQGLELRFRLSPVVIGRPVARELPNHRERHALRLIRDGLLFGPPRGSYAPAKLREILVRNVDPEGADRGVLGRRARLGGGLGARSGRSRERRIGENRGRSRRLRCGALAAEVMVAVTAREGGSQVDATGGSAACPCRRHTAGVRPG